MNPIIKKTVSIIMSLCLVTGVLTGAGTTAFAETGNGGSAIVVSAPLPGAHKITLTRCSTSNEFACAGDTVTLTADAAFTGQHLAGWICDDETVVIKRDVTGQTTATFTMPDHDISVEAVFEDHKGTMWGNDTEKHWRICDCGETLEEATHVFEWVVDTEPSDGTGGSKHEECKDCHFVRNQNTPIPKLHVDIEDVKVSPEKVTLTAAGEQVTLTAAILPENATDKEFLFKSENTDVATVSEDGVVTAVGNGTTQIRVIPDDSDIEAACEVTVAIKAERIELAASEITLTTRGASTLIGSTVVPSNAVHREVKFRSSDPEIVNVSKRGIAYAHNNGTAIITAEVFNDDGSVEASATCKVIVDVQTVERRISGETRFDTAVKVSQDTFTTANNVVLASAYNYPDALSAAPLAYALNGPILLASENKLEESIVNELERLQAEDVYIVGGKYAVSADIEKELMGYGYKIHRIAGDNRYETCVKIAEKLTAVAGAPSEVFITSGEDFPDAISISSVASMNGCPILYVDKSGKLSPEVAEFIKTIEAEKAIILGGTIAVASSIDSELNEGCRVPVIERLAGANRYETMLAINYAYINSFAGNGVCVATGENYPDALTGSVFAARNKIPMVLVSSSLTEDSRTTEFVTNKDVDNIFVLGGESAVSAKAVNTLLSRYNTVAK